MPKSEKWLVGCDGQCGESFYVESAGEPPCENLYFCCDECRDWYESADDDDDQ